MNVKCTLTCLLFLRVRYRGGKTGCSLAIFLHPHRMIPKCISPQIIRSPEVNQRNTALRISFTLFLARLSSPSVIKAASADVAHSIPVLYKQQYNYTRLCHLESLQKDAAWSTGGQRFPLMLCFLEGLTLIPQCHLHIPTTQTDTR